MGTEQILLSLGLPTLISALLIVPAWVLPRFRRVAGISGSALGVALGLALILCFMSEAGVVKIPPVAKWHMLAIIACGVTVLCPVVGILDGSGAIGRWLIAITAGSIIGWLSTFPGMELLHRALLGLWVGGSFVSLSFVSHHARGQTVNLAMTITFAGLSVLAFESAFITLTLLCIALASTCFVAWVSALAATLWTRDEAGRPRTVAIGWGGAFAIATLLPIMTFCGWAYNQGDVQWGHWMLIAIAPVLLGIYELPRLRNIEGWKGYALRIATVAAPVALAVVLVSTGGGKEASSGTGGYNLDSYLSP